MSSTEVKQRTIPNQGIRSSGKNSIRMGLSFGLIIGLIGGLSVFALIVALIVVQQSVGVSDERVGLSDGLSVALSAGRSVGLLNGGATCIKHYNLRRILHRKGRIPWNYADFLGC